MAHWSDCAVHNPPARPAGPCDCGNDAPDGNDTDAENAMTPEQARARICEMENQYGVSDTWPASYQAEFERLCDIIHGKRILEK